MAEIRLFGVHSRGQVALLAVIATAVVALAAAMFYAGWSAGGRGSTEAADRPASAAAVAPVVLSSDQAAHQACLGYLSLARQWVSVTSDWSFAVRDAGKSWSFSDPAIREASDKLWEPQSRVATGLRGLVGPQTPAPIAAAIYRYVDVVLGFPYSIYDEERTTPVVQANIDDLMSARADVLNACKGTGTPLP